MILRFLALFSFIASVLLIDPAIAEVSVPDSAYGKVIQSIEFETSVNLSFRELMFGLPIRSGNILRRGDIEGSIGALQVRNIFGEVNVRAEDVVGEPLAIKLVFDLPPAGTVTDAVFRGYHLLDEQRLRRLAGLALGTAIPTSELEAAAQRIKKGYQDYGIYSPNITFELQTTTFESMAVVEFTIDEGRQSTVGEVQFEGEFPKDVAYLRERFKDRAVGAPATKAELDDLRQELLQALRQEGYLQAAVDVSSSDFLLLTGDIKVTVKVRTKDPFGIQFVGNTVFSERELLESLKIATRTVPFSPNAIENLTHEIVDLYQSRGYYYATASSESLPSTDNRRPFRITIYEGTQTFVRSISVSGNRVFTSEEIVDKLSIRPAGVWFLRRWSPGYMVQSDVDSDLQAIRDLYAAAGYPGTTADLAVTDQPEEDGLDLTINIEEGPPVTAKAVTIRFAPLRDSDDSETAEQSEVALQGIEPDIDPSLPLSVERVEKERLHILNLITERGYPKSEVSANINTTKQDLEFVVTPGPRIEIGTIYLSGNMFTRDFVIRRELLISAGGPWNSELVRQSEQRLSSLGVFRSVEIKPADGTLDGPVEDAVVTVTERESGSVDLGVAFDTEDGLHLSSRIGNRNFDGEARDLVLGVDGYIKTGSNLLDAGHLQATYRIPEPFRVKGDLYFELFGQYSIQLIDQYDYNRTGVGSFYRAPLTEKLSGSIGIREMIDNLYNVQPDVIIGEHDEGATLYSILQGQFEWEDRDDIYNPRSGFRSQLQYNLASQVLGSEADFVGATWKNSFYLPLSTDLIWANGLTLQGLEPFAGSDTIPLDQRIFLGGRGSLRGFSRYSVGPRGFEKDIAGGDRALIINTELQCLFADNIVGLTFLDVGQTWLSNKGDFTQDPKSIDDLRFSPGLGVRYLTPIGPVSMEYGFAMNREFGERVGRFTLSVGGAF